MATLKNLDELLNSVNLNDSIIEIDNFISQLCEYGENLNALTESQKQLFFIQEFEREMNNGGFKQYFTNSSGDNAQETVVALNLIGAKSMAKILQKAIDKFPNKKAPKERDERENIVEKMEEKNDEIWEKLEEKFYEYPYNLNELNIVYIKQNKQDF